MTKNTRWLIAGAASALIAGSGLAFGQSMQQAPSSGASGGTSMGSGMQGGSSTERSGSSTERNLSGSGATSGQEGGSMRGSQPSTSGQSSSSGRTQSEQPQAQDKGGATQRSGTQSQQSGTSSQTSGQGSASSGASTSINLSSQQRTQIKQVVVKHRDIPHVNNVNVNIAVGAVLPSTVELIDVPEDVVAVFPRFRRHKIVIIKNEIVIVEPSSLKIVAVLPA